jgi:hypothetical protein
MKGLEHPATAVVAICAALIAGGASYAAAGSLSSRAASSHRLYACVAGAGEPGELSLSTATATCPNGGQKISWSVQGRRGSRGKTGGRGPTGSTGATGSQGPQGLQGLPGPKGDQGLQGLPGPKGDQGLQGIQGIQGLQGTAGTNGTNGSNGTSVTSAALSAGSANCPNGGSSFTAASGTTYACNGAQGPKGDTGATGTLASAYLDAYSSTSVALSTNSDFAFDTLAVAPVGITANTGHTAFTVSAAGTYLLIVLPNFAALGPSGPFQLTVNGTGVGPTGLVTFSRILSLSAGDVVTVRDVGTATTELAGAGITIVRIS